VERITRIDRTGAVAAAAAHDWNEELTVILSSIDSLLETVTASGPARQILLELRGAAQRCAWKSSGLLNFAARRGARPSAASMESLIT
jgi:C4-dicarboxylate-specific signal transduction histidine kinase